MFDRVGSTNDIAVEAARAGVASGLVVQAREQVRGKGRKARDWGSPRGGLWMSVVLESRVPEHAMGLVPLSVGCSCCEALRSLGVGAEVRWPNDVMVENRKVGGVLVESGMVEGRVSRVVAGVGINVGNEPPVEEGISLREVGVRASVDEVRRRVLDRLMEYEEILVEGKAKTVCNRFMRYAWGIDRLMLLDGVACFPREIAVDGALIVEDEEGEVSVHRTGSLRLPEA